MLLNFNPTGSHWRNLTGAIREKGTGYERNTGFLKAAEPHLLAHAADKNAAVNSSYHVSVPKQSCCTSNSAFFRSMSPSNELQQRFLLLPLYHLFCLRFRPHLYLSGRMRKRSWSLQESTLSLAFQNAFHSLASQLVDRAVQR